MKKTRGTINKYLKYEIYADETQTMIDYRSSKKEAVKRAYELMYKYGKMTVIENKTGKIVYETAR